MQILSDFKNSNCENTRYMAYDNNTQDQSESRIHKFIAETYQHNGAQPMSDLSQMSGDRKSNQG